MKKLAIILILLISLLMGNILKAQNLGIGLDTFDPDASAGVEMRFTNKGLLIPRVPLTSTTSTSPIITPIAISLLVYNTATTGDVTPGYYYWTGSKWMRLLAIDDKFAWLLSGNAGTTPTTNFLGTTDAQPLVIRTNNTERSRILSNGQVLINRTTAVYSGDLLEVQGNSTYPFAINGLTDQASGAGVYGYNSASGGISIWGETSNGFGVLGSASTGYGVYGSATGGTGVYASDNSAAGTGQAIYAKNFHASGNAILAAGNNLNPIYITGGVGGAFSSTNVGVFGYGDITSGSWGIAGYSAAANGTGIVGLITAAAGANVGDGIHGETNQSGGSGVFGVNTHASGTGVIGAGNNQAASYLTAGSGGAFTGSTIGVYGYATGSGDDTWGGYFRNSGTAFAYVGGRTGGTDYKINGTGAVSTIVKNTVGERVNLYCPEAPEIYFQDYGEGQLVNGKAHIELDPDFAINVTINEKHPLRVFIQLEDDCNGVYVTNKTQTGFDVIELNGGRSNAKFMWTVTANRADEVDENGNIISKYADVRFGPAPGPLESVETKESKANNKEIEEVESLDKKNLNINKTKNQ
jgi:hypothetical protein